MPKIQKLISIEPNINQAFATWCRENKVSQSAQIQTLITQHLNKDKQPDALQVEAEKMYAYKQALIAKHGQQKAIEILMQEAEAKALE